MIVECGSWCWHRRTRPRAHTRGRSDVRRGTPPRECSTKPVQTGVEERMSSNGVKWEAAGSGSRAFKGGAYGMQGAGKTTTMAIVARLLAQRTKQKAAYM